MNKKMIFEEYYEFAKEEWERRMETTEYVSLNKKSKQEMIELWNNISQVYDKNNEKSLERISKNIQVLKEKNAINKKSKVLDIGAGTGAYAIPISKLVEKVYAVEFSEGMITKLKEKISYNEIDNIDIIEEECIEFLKTQKDNEYDLVISSLNPTLYKIEGIEEMIRVSKGYCMYVAVANVFDDNQKYIKDLNELLLKKKIKNLGSNDIIHPFNILYSKGFFPEIYYFHVDENKVINKKEAIENIKSKYKRYIELTKEVISKIEKYVEENSIEDKFETLNKITFGVLIWKVS